MNASDLGARAAVAARFVSRMDGWRRVCLCPLSFGLSLGLLPAACVRVGADREQLQTDVQRRCVVSHVVVSLLLSVLAASERLRGVPAKTAVQRPAMRTSRFINRFIH